MQPQPGRIYRFFHSGRSDSPFRRLWINALLILACIIAIYPVLRVVTVSLRPGDRLLSTSLDLIPQDATLQNYARLFTEKDFLVWVWNSIIITITVSLIGVVLAATSAYAFSRWKFRMRTGGLVFLFNFMNAWQEFPVAYRVVTQENMWTWTLGINAMQGQFQTEWGMYAAASVLIMFPVVLLFLYSAKWLISGLTLGSVKG